MSAAREALSAPMLRVVRGDATPEEIAALVAVLTARARRAPARDDGAVRRSSWADRSRGLRTPLPHGADAWRASARPH